MNSFGSTHILISKSLLIVGVLTGIACSSPHERSGPLDTVEAGQLCVPATDGCSSETVVSRDSVGANVLDFRLRNRGSRTARVTVSVSAAGVPGNASSQMDADTGVGADGETDVSEEPVDFPSRDFLLAPGESIEQRFGQRELFTRQSLNLMVSCTDCDVKLVYTFLSAPVDCRGDEDCSGDWFCLVDRGECVECRTDDDCESNQTCSSIDNQCVPRSIGGCQTTGGSTTALGLYICLGLVLVAFGFVRRRALLAVIGLITVVGLPQAASAADFAASIDVGGGSRFLTGELGDDAKRGLGMSVEQTFRSEQFGLSGSYTLEYFLTTQRPPPFARELRMFSFGLAPRVYYDWNGIEMSAGPVYRRLGLISNSLIREIGRGTNYNAFGGSVGISHQFSQLYVEATGEFLPIQGLNGSLVSINLSFGFAAGSL